MLEAGGSSGVATVASVPEPPPDPPPQEDRPAAVRKTIISVRVVRIAAFVRWRDAFELSNAAVILAESFR